MQAKQRTRETELPGELGPGLNESIESNPYVAVGSAFALGFVLGGGLTPSLLRLGLGLGARAAVVALARDAISGVDSAS